MLSVIIISAITAVALPSLRITTLSQIRVISISALFMVYIIIITWSYNSSLITVDNAIVLFDGIIVIDTLGIGIVSLSIVIMVVTLIHNTSLITVNTSYIIPVLICIVLFGSYYLATSHDIITLSLALELQSFSIYAITTIYRWRIGSTQAGLIYFILGAFGSGIVLLSISIIYVYTSQTDYDAIISLCNINQSAGINYDYISIAIIVLISGLLFKLAASPFHYWAPNVYDNVPTIVTVIITLIPKIGIIALIIRISIIWNNSYGIISIIIACIIISIIIGSIIGLVQIRIKRILAYSTINHIGWILLSITIGGIIGLGAIGFYIIQYSLITGITFIVLISLSNNNIDTNSVNDGDVENINSISGLYNRYIILSIIIVIGLFSAAGIPPIIGFYAKLSVIQVAIHHSQYMVTIIGIITSVISAGFYLSLIANITFIQYSSHK